MNLSSLVHSSRHHHHHHHQFPERYPSSYAPSREQQQQIMTSSMVSIHTAQPVVGQVVNYAYVPAPQAPPSPPIDENSKCSLPSISSLLGLADGGSPEGSPKQQPSAQPSPPPPNHQQAQQPQQSQQSVPQQHVMVDYRQNQTSQYDVPTPVSIPRGALPPTPPMHMDSGFDGRQSPSATPGSQFSLPSAQGYYFHPSAASSISDLEPQSQRQAVPVPVQQRRATMPTQAPLAYQPSQYGPSHYGMPSSQQPMNSYYGSPMQQTPPQQQISGLYYQRPLPQFSPSIIQGSVSMPPTRENPWQHHHYISPSSQASFPQSQDRYICPTCQKAFSRPSSLRIHSHSHTGEKPFKCPHQGCGKAFSVRSNMKRHERGCHTFESHGSMQ